MCIEQEAEWAPEMVWMLWTKEFLNLLVSEPCWDHPASSVANCTKYANKYQNVVASLTEFTQT